MEHVSYSRRDQNDLGDALATWTVFVGDDAIGRIAEMGFRDYRVTYAGLGVRDYTPYQRHLTRDDAARFLLEVRARARSLEITPSGLTGLQEDILVAESQFVTEPRPGERDRAAAALGVSPTQYLQIMFALIDNPLAQEFLPHTVARLRERRNAGAIRRARLTREGGLAAAS